MTKNLISIILIAIIVALTYNYFRPDGLELIRTKAPEVSDAELFGDNSKSDVETESGNSESSSGEELDDAKSLTYEQMKKHLDNPEVVYIDARSPDAFEKNRIGNAINIFPHDDEGEIMNKIMDLDENKTYFLYCNSITCDLSHELKEYMDQMLDRVFIYDGGWDEWAKKEGIE